MTSISIKEYADIIGKSDKTVYKMVKNGQLQSIKRDKVLHVVLDGNLFEAYQNVCKTFESLQANIDALTLRIEALEKPATLKPISQKSVKKSVKKSNTGRTFKSGSTKRSTPIKNGLKTVSAKKQSPKKSSALKKSKPLKKAGTKKLLKAKK